jgi:hypothetical protein
LRGVLLTSKLIDVLRELPPSGSGGFEGLVSSLLEALTGRHFSLARSGSQEGRDMSSRVPEANVVAVECKRYGRDTELDERQLLGEMVQATRDIPDLDLWVLVASREVPSQLLESLNRQASETGIGFFALSDGDGDPGSLEVLCANSPEVVLNHAGIPAGCDKDELKKVLDGFSQHANYARRLSDLREYFVSSLAGYGNWRVRQNEGFLSSLTSSREARAQYGQPINLDEPGVLLVPRTSVRTAITKWYEGWKDSHSFLSVLGEEGDGKTWGVASWLANVIKGDDDVPAIVFLSSTDIADGADGPDVHGLLVTQISKRLRVGSREQASRRLERWVTRAAGDAPLIVVVFDGINERGAPDWWRRLLEQLAGETWNNHIAVIITCRTSYWERHFKTLSYLPVASFVTGPFNDTELDIALGYHNVTRESLQEGLLPLIRKPRYFDLMVKHREQITISGDVTPARLLFEDWRDRLERKANISLTVEEFQNLIRRLAEQHLIAHFSFSEEDVTGALPTSLDRSAVLEELRTGGVLQESGGKYTVNKQSLVYGLGLLLVDQLREAVNGDDDPREVIARWMEPHAEMDIKAEISEFAVLYVLGSDILPLKHKVALLESWVGSSNPAPDAAERLSAYLSRDPEAYVGLAESVWSDEYDNRWAQENLTLAFIRCYQYPSVSRVLLAAFERWLGFVHIEGTPIQRHKAEDGQRLRCEIATRLGRTVELGPVSLGAYTLTIIQDDGLLRLSRVALAVISHLQRPPFVRALAVGCLADALMGYPFKYELSAWVVRTCQDDVWTSLRSEINQLLALDSDIGRKAAVRLLSFEGSASASELIKSIPQETSRSKVVERHEQDPCTSFLQWNREECLKCLQREGLNPDWAARQIKNYVIDPSFPVPPSFIEELIESLNNVNKDQIWIVLGTTAEDHRLDTAEPTLAAHAPDALAEFIRSIDREISTRNGLNRRQLSIALGNHYLIFRHEEREAVRHAWENLIASAATWSKDEGEAEMFLLEVLLPQLSAEDQLSALLRRPERAANLIRYESNFLPLATFDAVRAQLTNETAVEVLHRILWFLTEHPSAIPIDLLETTILPLIDRDDSIIRSKVLELVYETKSPAAVGSIVNGTWKWDLSRDTFENHWGSLVLCEHGASLSFAELCGRIDPSYLGYAVTCRGNNSDEVKQYAELLHQVLLRLTKSGADLPLELPQFTIESSVEQRIEHVPRWSLAESSEQSITFASKYLRWGGIEPVGEFDFTDWNADASVRKRQKLQESVREAIAQQKESGNVWFGRDFRGAGLEEVITVRSDLIDEWVTSANPATAQGRERIRRGGAFYDALCTALLKQQTEKGVRLYWQLAETPGRTAVVDSDTQIDLLDFALFDMPKDGFLTVAWQRKLEECQSDQDLMKVVLLLQHGNATEWLWSYIVSRVDSEAPVDRARARVLLGFLDHDQSVTTMEQLLESDPETWMQELTQRARDQQDKRRWSKHWFRRFLTDSSDTSAWASFRLLLRCVDTSFWFWWESVKDQVNTIDRQSQRVTFMEDNSDNLRYAIAKNEKGITERLLGEKIMKRQVWPWM